MLDLVDPLCLDDGKDTVEGGRFVGYSKGFARIIIKKLGLRMKKVYRFEILLFLLRYFSKPGFLIMNIE